MKLAGLKGICASCRRIMHLIGKALKRLKYFCITVCNGTGCNVTSLRPMHKIEEELTMNQMIGYCGLDCKKCDAYLATIHKDDALREKTAKLWAKLNNAPILPEHINCEGCRVDGIKTPYCDSICPIRKCAMEKGVESCGHCSKLKTCETVKMVTSNNTEALDRLRSSQTEQ